MDAPATPKRFQFSVSNLLIVTLTLAAFLAGRASREGEVDRLSTAAEVAESRLSALQIKNPTVTVLTAAFLRGNPGLVAGGLKFGNDFEIERGMKADAIDREIRLDAVPLSNEGMFFAPVD